tara:strand:- start:392 stop:688 length:297 start_codon:yes stop_codon:yes gene_type:complete
MQLSEERLIEQMAYYLVSLDDPKAAGLFIYNCMNESNDRGPTDVAATQSMFMMVTRMMGEIDAAYSLRCSKEYLNLVKRDYGSSDELEKLLNQGDEYE